MTMVVGRRNAAMMLKTFANSRGAADDYVS